MIFDLIYQKDYQALKEFIHSEKCDVHIVDEMQRSPIFVCIVESNFEALLILLENKDFVKLFNSAMTIEDMNGTYEFMHAFMSYKEPTDLFALLPFIENINQKDDQGNTCLDYFLWGLEGYSLSFFVPQFKKDNSQTLQSQMNHNIKQFLEKAYEIGVDFTIKNKEGLTALEQFIQENEMYPSFRSSIDFIKSKLEKIVLEKQLTQNVLLANKNKL
jgi:hypothetical protein